MKFIYILLSIPAFVAFLIYSKRNYSIIEDFEAWKFRHCKEKRNKFLTFIHLMMKFPEYRYVLYFRLPFYVRHILNLILKRRNLMLCVKKIGGGIIVVHGWSTIVTAQSIGKNFVVHQNCTIGHNHGGCPIIGDDVKIYAGAVVAGPISIGNNVSIGANCVVLKDVPDNTICYGNPCVMKSKK